jgi:hypothetical protein
MNSKADTMETTIPKGRTLRILDGKGLDLREWVRGIRGRIAAGLRGRAAPTIGASVVTR